MVAWLPNLTGFKTQVARGNSLQAKVTLFLQVPETAIVAHETHEVSTLPACLPS